MTADRPATEPRRWLPENDPQVMRNRLLAHLPSDYRPMLDQLIEATRAEAAQGAAPLTCNCNAEMYGDGTRHSDDCATGLGAAPRAVWRSPWRPCTHGGYVACDPCVRERLLTEGAAPLAAHVGHLLGVIRPATLVCDTCEVEMVAAPRAEGLTVEEVSVALHEAGIGCSTEPCDYRTEFYEGVARTMHDTDARDLLTALSRPSDERQP